MNPNVTISPITLHCVPDEDPYDKYPRVGIVARATVTMKDPEFRLVVQSKGENWRTIEDEDLVACCRVPEGHWILSDTDVGEVQTGEVQAILRALLPDNPTPSPSVWCSVCGGTDIMCHDWIDPNAETVLGCLDSTWESLAREGQSYCADCNEHTVFTTDNPTTTPTKED